MSYKAEQSSQGGGEEDPQGVGRYPTRLINHPLGVGKDLPGVGVLVGISLG